MSNDGGSVEGVVDMERCAEGGGVLVRMTPPLEEELVSGLKLSPLWVES